MPFVDERGRLFGRVNIVDAALVAFLLVLMPIVYTATRLFRVPKPEIERVEPATQQTAPAPRIRVIGRNLRPYLTAVATPTGLPSLVEPAQVALPQAGNITLVSPSLVEIELPRLPAGVYDLRLFDTTREVARLTNAFSLTAPPAPPAPAAPERTPDKEAVVHARVRFIVLPEIVRLIRDNDAAATEKPAVTGAGDPAAARPAPIPRRAVLRSFRVIPETLPPGMDFGSGWGARLIQADIEIPVRQNARGEWDYRQQIIRIGEGFAFQTAAYTMNGVIGEMSVTPVKPARPGPADDK